LATTSRTTATCTAALESLKLTNRVNSEYGYFLRDQSGDSVPDKDNSTSARQCHASWDIAMAGGYIVTGFGTTYFGSSRDPGPLTWKRRRTTSGARHYLKTVRGGEWCAAAAWHCWVPPPAVRKASISIRSCHRPPLLVAEPGSNTWSMLAPEGGSSVKLINCRPAFRNAGQSPLASKDLGAVAGKTF
jgi:hypothetical protein